MLKNNTSYKPKESDTFNLRIIRNAILIFIPTFTIITIALIISLGTYEKLEKDIYKNAERNVVSTKLEYIQNEIHHVINDLFILKESRHFKQAWQEGHQSFSDPENDLKRVVQYRKTYGQGRLIDNNGQEIVRINLVNGTAVLVPSENLQNKKNRYYFSESIVLNKDEIYISPLDLNIENGKIETPFKPMLRIGTPVFDEDDNKKGVLIFNYLGKNIINQLNENSNVLLENQLMLVNKDGYWLKHPVIEYDWGFMFEDKKDVSFKKYYSSAWDKIELEEKGQFETKEGLFTFTSVYPILSSNLNNQFQTNAKNYYWKIISYIPSATLYSKQNQMRKYALLIVLLFGISLAYISFRFAKAQYFRKMALASLKTSNETKDKFFSVISHDLKGPFNSLLGFSQILKDEISAGNTTNIKKYSHIIHSTLNNTYDFLINLLDWSQSQSNRLEYNPEPFSFNSLVNNVIELLELQAEQKNIILKNKIAKDLIVKADKNMMNTIVRNLMSNAIKYSKPGGDVIVEAFVKNNMLNCVVKDSGVGIDEQSLNELFLLENVKSTKGTNNEKGTGLGLLLCKELIKKHHGRIGAQSKLGKGSEFWFEIPHNNT